MAILGERLRQLRKEKGMTAEQLGKEIGVGRTAISNYERGERQPNAEQLGAILDLFNVDLEWLEGKTEVKNIYNFDGIYKAGYEDGLKQSQLSASEQTLVDDFRTLDEWEQKMVQQMIQSLVEGNHSEPDEEDETVQYRTLMFYGGRPSAGSGNWLPDEAAMGKSQIQVVDTPKTRKADFVLEVDGSSMEPKFSDGDMILVKHQDAVDPGEIGVFLVNGQAVVKQCQHGYLHSLNPDYEDISLQEGDEVVCFGKVIGKL